MGTRERYGAEAEAVTASLLDTHYWIWLLQGDDTKLSRVAKQELLTIQRRGSLYISAVSVLELARLEAARRVELGMSIEHAIELSTVSGGLQIIPLSNRILIESTRLPGTLHRDPSDRLLIATAREHGLTLITRDKDILAYASEGHLNVRKL